MNMIVPLNTSSNFAYCLFYRSIPFNFWNIHKPARLRLTWNCLW